jgi:hypothetical protein
MAGRGPNPRNFGQIENRKSVDYENKKIGQG